MKGNQYTSAAVSLQPSAHPCVSVGLTKEGASALRWEHSQEQGTGSTNWAGPGGVVWSGRLVLGSES